MGVVSDRAPDELADRGKWRQTELERVTDWRESELFSAGYPIGVAVELSRRPDVDLHAAVALLEAGCAPALAAEILL